MSLSGKRVRRGFVEFPDMAVDPPVARMMGRNGNTLVYRGNFRVVDGNVIFPVVSGITAFAGGGQADATALTADINEVATVATTGDSVKLLSAAGGLEQTIINNGANACDVFPNTGDDLGAGVNVAVSLGAGSRITYLAWNTTNWV